MTPPGANPQLAERAWRSARRLFGARADDYEVSADFPALLIARGLMEDQGLSDTDAATVALDVIPEADANAVLSMLRLEATTSTG